MSDNHYTMGIVTHRCANTYVRLD